MLRTTNWIDAFMDNYGLYCPGNYLINVAEKLTVSKRSHEICYKGIF